MTEQFVMFETKAHLKREELCGQRVSDRLGLTLVKQTKRMVIDWRVQSAKTKRIRGWMECKCPDHDYGDFPTFFTSLKKWKALHEYASIPFVNSKSFLVVGYKNGDYIMDVSECDNCDVFESGWGSPRTGDDIEPCIHIPISRLIKLEESKWVKR